MAQVPVDLIDTILPSEEIHLLAGPSGAGKTRWLLRTLKFEWEAGLSVLGHTSHPVPWIYVAADRTLKSSTRTIKDIGINPEGMNIISAWPRNFNTINPMMDAIFKSGAKLAVIDGFGSFIEHPRAVRATLNSTYMAMRDTGLTLIAIVESPKMKPHERYELPRQRVSGVSAWAYHTGTTMLVEFSNPKEATNSPDRKLIVVPRHGRGIEYDAVFDDSGVLRVIDSTLTGFDSSSLLRRSAN